MHNSGCVWKVIARVDGLDGLALTDRFHTRQMVKRGWDFLLGGRKQVPGAVSLETVSQTS